MASMTRMKRGKNFQEAESRASLGSVNDFSDRNGSYSGVPGHAKTVRSAVPTGSGKVFAKTVAADSSGGAFCLTGTQVNPFTKVRIFKTTRIFRKVMLPAQVMECSI